MSLFFRLLSTLVMLTLMSGCAVFKNDSSSTQEAEPAALVKFKQQSEIRQQWSTRVGEGIGEHFIKLTPAINGARIFAADINGRVVALDRNTGKRQWRIKLNEELSGGVGAGFGLVFLGTQSGQLLALNQEDGTEAWRVELSSEILSIPKTNARTLVVQTLDEKVYGFEHATGKQLWRYESNAATLSLRGTSSPILTSDVALVGFGNGYIVALNADSGAILWKQRATVPQGRTEFERMTDVDGELLLAGDVLYATSFQGFAVALDLQTGRPLWRKELSSFQGPDESLGNLYVSDAKDHVYALDQRSSEQVWQQASLEGRKLTAPVAIGNRLAVADAQGYLHIMAQRDGQFVARKKIDGEGIRSTPLAKGNTLYVYGNSGKLVALTIESID